MLAGCQKHLWTMQIPEQPLGSLWGSTSWHRPKPPYEALQEFNGKIGYNSVTQEYFPKLSWSSLLAAPFVCVPPLLFLCQSREGAESHGRTAEETDTHIQTHEYRSGIFSFWYISLCFSSNCWTIRSLIISLESTLTLNHTEPLEIIE